MADTEERQDQAAREAGERAGERDGGRRGGPVDSEGKPVTPAEKKKNDNRQRAIIALTALGVIVTYLIYRSSKNSAGGAGVSGIGYTTGGYPPAGVVAGGGGTNNGARAGLANYLRTLEHEISQLEATQRHMLHDLRGLRHPAHRGGHRPHPKDGGGGGSDSGQHPHPHIAERRLHRIYARRHRADHAGAGHVGGGHTGGGRRIPIRRRGQ